MFIHLSPWAGAIAGLRIVDAGMAIGMACAYRHVLFRMIGRRFAAKGSDVVGGGLAMLSCGILCQTLFGLVLIATKGGVPADNETWSRVTIATAYLFLNIGFTIIFAGMTTRAWLVQGLSLETAGREGRRAIVRIARITLGTMATGAALAMVHGG